MYTNLNRAIFEEVALTKYHVSENKKELKILVELY